MPQATGPGHPVMRDTVAILGVMSAENEEQILLDRIRDLDERTLGHLHDRYYPELFRFALYRIGDQQSAEDVASEVFVRLIDAVKVGRGPAQTVRGWLFGVASNLVAEHFRKAPRESAELHDEMPASGSIVGEVETRIRNAQLVRSMQALTREQQEVLSFRFALGYSLEETATAMGRNVNTIKQLQFRAVSALKRQLELDGGAA